MVHVQVLTLPIQVIQLFGPSFRQKKSISKLYFSSNWARLNLYILAFAELQTDMSDLVSELNATGIPYWDYKNFTFKILFPGETDHPTLHKLMVIVSAW